MMRAMVFSNKKALSYAKIAIAVMGGIIIVLLIALAYPQKTLLPNQLIVSTSIPQKKSTNTKLKWGAYVGDAHNNVARFESLVGKKADIIADFEGWDNAFPQDLSETVGQQGKTLVIFWEPSFGYDEIINGSKDNYIRQFVSSAKSYGYPIILAPFDEMNLNEESWGYGQNDNTAAKFQEAWKHVHEMFAGTNNVKFVIAFNNVSIPDISGNKFPDYYPGSSYVDYVGVDGFNFGKPWQTFGEIFDDAISQAEAFRKPIFIMSMGTTEGPQKADWITDGLGTHIKNYSNVLGWIWFNQNDAKTPGSGDVADWTVNSDNSSLKAFQSVIN